MQEQKSEWKILELKAFYTYTWLIGFLKAIPSSYIELVLGSTFMMVGETVPAVSLFPPASCLSWYSWKHGTMQRLVWHSGQWYFVLRRKIRPWPSIVFQQKLQPNAGPGRNRGQCPDRCDSNPSLGDEAWERI